MKSIDLNTNGKPVVHFSSAHFSSALRIRGNSGFSLFELVVFIISVAIIYAYAANRFAEFPAQAERASFIAVLTQLQAGINLELMFGMGAGGLQNAELLDGINPMDLMLSAPTNYLGAFSEVDTNELPRRSWYFDLNSEELVYLANDAAGLFLELNGIRVATDTLRFRVGAVTRAYDSATGLDAVIATRANAGIENQMEERFAGILLQPVVPYYWNSEDADELMSSALASGNE